MKKLFFPALLMAALTAQGVTLDVDASRLKKAVKVSPTMYGIFFEDINFGADGGLYAEKIKNRSFEFPQAFMGWDTYGNVALREDGPFERNPHYVRLSPSGHAHKRTGLQNEGFFGVSWHAGEQLRFSVWARGKGGRIDVQLVNPAASGETQVMASQTLDITSDNWERYTLTLTPEEGLSKGMLRINLRGDRSVDLEHISLFPADTWKGREGGMRKDLAAKLDSLNPGVFRFPGGCIVEGTDLASRYQWKNTVGPVENRLLNENRWHYTFPHRLYPDYYQTGGLGFFEYFQLSEDFGAEPLPVLSVGLACQYQNSDPEAHVALDDLQPYIDDAVDLVEFARGDSTTTWGRVRAQMGHPEPFTLNYIAIGNEQWDSLYTQRLALFIDRMRKECPDIKIIGSSGPDSEGAKYDYLWPEMRRLGVDLVDEHFYRPAEWFINGATRYDKFPRKGPKVFAGEYACHLKGHKQNHFKASLLEAAFMTGLERNADVVTMATYAPLFAHVDGWQWRPDLIWFDNLNSVASASYYVQQIYGTNPGTHVLPATTNGEPLTGQDGLYASAVYDQPSGEYIVKVVNINDEPRPFAINLKGAKPESLTTITLTSTDLMADNTLESPRAVVPVTENVPLADSYTIPANSFVTFKMK